MTSLGGEVTCSSEKVGGESSWRRDDWIPLLIYQVVQPTYEFLVLRSRIHQHLTLLNTASLAMLN